LFEVFLVKQFVSAFVLCILFLIDQNGLLTQTRYKIGLSQKNCRLINKQVRYLDEYCTNFQLLVQVN